MMRGSAAIKSASSSRTDCPTHVTAPLLAARIGDAAVQLRRGQLYRRDGAGMLHSPPEAVKLIDNATVSYAHSGHAARGADSASESPAGSRKPNATHA